MCSKIFDWKSSAPSSGSFGPRPSPPQTRTKASGASKKVSPSKLQTVIIYFLKYQIKKEKRKTDFFFFIFSYENYSHAKFFEF